MWWCSDTPASTSCRVPASQASPRPSGERSTTPRTCSTGCWPSGRPTRGSPSPASWTSSPGTSSARVTRGSTACPSRSPTRTTRRRSGSRAAICRPSAPRRSARVDPARPGGHGGTTGPTGGAAVRRAGAGKQIPGSVALDQVLTACGRLAGLGPEVRDPVDPAVLVEGEEVDGVRLLRPEGDQRPGGGLAPLSVGHDPLDPDLPGPRVLPVEPDVALLAEYALAALRQLVHHVVGEGGGEGGPVPRPGRGPVRLHSDPLPSRPPRHTRVTSRPSHAT